MFGERGREREMKGGGGGGGGGEGGGMKAPPHPVGIADHTRSPLGRKLLK